MLCKAALDDQTQAIDLPSGEGQLKASYIAQLRPSLTCWGWIQGITSLIWKLQSGFPKQSDICIPFTWMSGYGQANLSFLEEEGLCAFFFLSLLPAVALECNTAT